MTRIRHFRPAAFALGVLGFLILLAAPALGFQAVPGHRVGPASGEGGDLPPVLYPGRIPGDHTSIEIAFSISVLAWGLALICILTWVMMRTGKVWNAVYLRLCVLGIVVTAGLFVVVAGYTEQQIAPMMGLLGTLVGYLLGKGVETRNREPREPRETQEKE